MQITNAVEGSGNEQGLIIGYDSASGAQVINSYTKPLVINTSPSTSRLLLQPTGDDRRVGIGSTTPNNKLDVIGNTYISGNLGIGTTNPSEKLQVIGDARVGIDTSSGVILTAENGTKYRLIVSTAGVLSTVLVP
jgi:hypothetical protein